MRLLKIAAILFLIAGAFAGGYVLRHAQPATAPAQERRVLYWVDPMHPAYTSDKPGIAPDCGMQLEPVYADDALTASAASNAPAGAVHITPERQQLIGVTFATVERGGAARAIRTIGRVSADETRIGHVHTRIEGWIERVHVDFTGDVVKKGEPMLTIYSPEMLASQQELLLARRARDLMSGNPLASAARHGETLFEAARRRLQLWELSDDQIQRVLDTEEPIRSISVRAPMSGFVTERNAFPNQKVTPDSELYTITDLSRVWIVADVFESDITAISLGDTARVSFANGSAPALTARVSYIQPQVDPMTRTVQVRLDAANPGTRMKPDMFVNVEFGIATTPQLTVPAGAVLDTGDRQTVFVDLGGGYLEPRRVVVGDRFGDRVAISEGLAAGERVVASGTFLVDSESQLQAAAGAMGAPGAAQHQHDAPATPARPDAAPVPEAAPPGKKAPPQATTPPAAMLAPAVMSLPEAGPARAPATAHTPAPIPEAVPEADTRATPEAPGAAQAHVHGDEHDHRGIRP
jgi:RND family efflux transporter MFP subunit